MSEAEWAAYVAMGIAYGAAFYYSISNTSAGSTKAAKIVAGVFSALVGALWIITMPFFSFVMLIMAGRKR